MNYSWHHGQVGVESAPPDRSDLAVLDARYFNLPPFNDEPKLFHVAVLLPDADTEGEVGRAGGSSWELGRAMAKAAGEAVERISAFPPADLPHPLSYDDVRGDRLDPNVYDCVEPKNGPSRDGVIRWHPAWRLTLNGARPGSVPSQLVHLPYPPAKGEPLWFVPTSNGLAAGANLEHASWNALAELIERDALFTSWFGDGETTLIRDPASGGADVPALADLLATTHHYRLETTFIALPSAADLLVVACVLKDSSGFGPPTTIGLKSGVHLGTVLLGALEEAHQLRPWLRELQADDGSCPAVLQTIEDRARWWLTNDAQVLLALWLSRARSGEIPQGPETLGQLVTALHALTSEIWVAELESVNPAYAVARAVVPALQPPYFDERAPILLRRLARSDGSTPRHPLL